jgi:hypothetical protein
MKTTMKTTMKFFAAIAIMMCFTMGAMAQNAVTGSVNASASVQTKLDVSQDQALNFGIVDNVLGQTKTVSVTGIATSGGNAVSTTGVTAGIGKIIRTGDAIVTYKLSVVPPFLAGSGVNKLPIGTWTTSYILTTKSNEGQSAGNVVVASETQVAGSGGTIYVYIGATVTPSSDTVDIGEYSGALTLSAEYN